LQGAGATFEGQHVWAARYQKIDAAFTLVKSGESFPTSSIQLLNIFSAQRGGDKDVARLQLLMAPEEEAGKTDTIAPTADDWKDFDMEVAEIEQLLEDED
jgi:hypothetical protein